MGVTEATYTQTYTEEVLRDVFKERCRQIDKWGHQHHSHGEWYAIEGEEFGEVGKEINHLHFGSSTPEGISRRTAMLREELVQVAAVAVAWIEDIDYNG